MADLNPSESQWFGAQNRKVQQQYSLGSAQNLYDRDLTTQQYQWNKTNLARQYADARTKMPGGFSQRGLLNSGIYSGAIDKFNADRQNAFNQLTGKQALALRQFNLTGSQLQGVRDAALADLAEQKAAYRRTLAASIYGNT